MSETTATIGSGPLAHRISRSFDSDRWIYFIGALLAAAIVVSRRPQMLFSPQFWAEDGKIWYADAYNQGIIYPLLTTDNGYFQTFSRLVAVVAQAFPFQQGPLVFFLAALSVQAITAMFIVSPRMAGLIGDIRGRILLAFIYLVLPHSWEVIANLTNSQWHIALLALLILISRPGVGPASRIFDYAVIAMCALSGPFCLLLLPVAAIRAYSRRDAHMFTLFALLFGGTIVQGISLISVGRTLRPQLGASFELFFRILGRHIFAGIIIGGKGFQFLQRNSLWSIPAVVLVNLSGIAAIIFGLYRSTAAIRLMILFSSLICLTALILPAVTRDQGQWQVMADHDTALRYWFIPIFTGFAVLVYFAFEIRSRAVRYLAIVILLASSAGIIFDWRLTPLEDRGFSGYANALANAAPGTEVVIPINPDWEMRLIKK